MAKILDYPKHSVFYNGSSLDELETSFLCDSDKYGTHRVKYSDLLSALFNGANGHGVFESGFIEDNNTMWFTTGDYYKMYGKYILLPGNICILFGSAMLKSGSINCKYSLPITPKYYKYVSNHYESANINGNVGYTSTLSVSDVNYTINLSSETSNSITYPCLEIMRNDRTAIPSSKDTAVINFVLLYMY